MLTTRASISSRYTSNYLLDIINPWTITCPAKKQKMGQVQILDSSKTCPGRPSNGSSNILIEHGCRRGKGGAHSGGLCSRLWTPSVRQLRAPCTLVGHETLALCCTMHLWWKSYGWSLKPVNSRKSYRLQKVNHDNMSAVINTESEQKELLLVRIIFVLVRYKSIR